MNYLPTYQYLSIYCSTSAVQLIIMSQLERQLKNSLNSRREKSELRQLTLNHPNAIDFYSNDFLGFSHSKEMRDDYLNELNSMPHILGSTGSRLVSGNSTYAETLERYIADFHRSPTALIFNSGYDANFSIFSTLPQNGDIVLYDEFVHASVHEGMRSSRASHCIPFTHSDVSNLELHIGTFKDTNQNVFIAIETVYSMDGDIAPLKGIVGVLRKYWPNGENGFLIVDEVRY